MCFACAQLIHLAFEPVMNTYLRLEETKLTPPRCRVRGRVYSRRSMNGNEPSFEHNGFENWEKMAIKLITWFHNHIKTFAPQNATHLCLDSNRICTNLCKHNLLPRTIPRIRSAWPLTCVFTCRSVVSRKHCARGQASENNVTKPTELKRTVACTIKRTNYPWFSVHSSSLYFQWKDHFERREKSSTPWLRGRSFDGMEILWFAEGAGSVIPTPNIETFRTNCY